MKNLTWQNPEQLFVAQELINKVKSKCCGIKDRFNITQNNSLLTTQWDNFYKHIDLSFDNFYTLLKDNFSDLNEKELQLCCMMVAGFKTEEIAAIWMQSIFSVHKYKTNIRKKLKTPEGANIIAFLMSAPPFQ